jgi:hypothetical protein
MNVRFWPKADIRTVTANVAFGGKAGIHRTPRPCLLLTQSGHPGRSLLRPNLRVTGLNTKYDSHESDPGAQ